MKILVSRCLLGERCRYKGDGCPSETVMNLAKEHTLIGVCPEVDGGLPTPRAPGERRGNRVVTKDGADVTAEYEAGAKIALETARREGAELCIMKAKSPSCGSGKIYDGTFGGNLIDGDGVAAELLKRNGFRVITENEAEEIFGGNK